ncbi:MAG: hypothetical protein QM756_34545 [Polyangiaceae bacterium]
MDWTIHGAKDPGMCEVGGAATLEVDVDDGASTVQVLPRCSDFATSIDLPPGRYSGVAVLLDAGGADCTTEVDLGSFTIYGSDVLTIPVEFPPSSFY